MLRLVAAWAKAPNTGQPNLAALLDHADIHAYLVSEMYYALSEGASRLLRWICALRRPLDLGGPVGQATLGEAGRRKAGLDAIEERRARGLLLQSSPQVFQPPALVRDHVLQQSHADRATWRRMHKRIAKAYTAVGDLIEMNYHMGQAE